MAACWIPWRRWPWLATYIFNVSSELDEDGWCMFYLPLEHISAST
jgi:hypothetical protein